MEKNTFKDKLKFYQTFINNELENYMPKTNEESPEKILRDSMYYSTMAGGKRIRPILMLATYDIFKTDNKVCIPFAIAMEMVHNFSLIHDDLPAIDNDDYRHSKLTNHKVFGESTAILAGDALLNYAFLILSKELLKEDLNLKIKIQCYNEFTNAIDRMIIGEYVDTVSEGKFISNEMLEYMHKNKTGAFIKSSVRIGAMLAEVNNDDIEILTRFAENIGLAFQIKDDILSEIGTYETLGKPVGNDAKLNKSTYVSMYGVEKSKEILNKITEESIELISRFGEKSWFLKELSIYIRDREK